MCLHELKGGTSIPTGIPFSYWLDGQGFFSRRTLPDGFLLDHMSKTLGDLLTHDGEGSFYAEPLFVAGELLYFCAKHGSAETLSGLLSF